MVFLVEASKTLVWFGIDLLTILYQTNKLTGLWNDMVLTSLVRTITTVPEASSNKTGCILLDLRAIHQAYGSGTCVSLLPFWVTVRTSAGHASLDRH